MGGEDRTGKREAVAAVARALRTPAFLIDAADIPSDWSQRHALALFLDRELALSRAVAMIEGTAETAAMAARLADAVQGPLVISAPEPEPPERAPRRRLDMPDADPSERSKLWRAALRDRATIGPGLEQLAERFPLDTAGILATAEAARLADPSTLFDALWQAAREQGRPRLEGLAERIETDASWDDLVLPQDQLGILRDLAGHLRHAWTVNHTWGWLAKGARGLGAAALFAGPQRTGKTLAAEVLAAELKLDLYRIDLSQVVSKYIGETEKNLRSVFDAAERGGAILLFDEADALFGKRSEVKDSHDRYANVEVSYLLQRMEAYRGLAILTTNQRSALDRAFLRRLRFVVTFPFPDAAARAEIWSRVFPPETPTEKLDPRRLARLGLSGGSIRVDRAQRRVPCRRERRAGHDAPRAARGAARIRQAREAVRRHRVGGFPVSRRVVLRIGRVVTDRPGLTREALAEALAQEVRATLASGGMAPFGASGRREPAAPPPLGSAGAGAVARAILGSGAAMSHVYAHPEAEVAHVAAPQLQRACACGESAGVSGKCPECAAREQLGVQPKLSLNRPGDRYEQEADRIADRIVSAREPGTAARTSPLLQRQPEGDEEDEDLQAKPEGLQRQAEEEEDEGDPGEVGGRSGRGRGRRARGGRRRRRRPAALEGRAVVV